MEKNIPTVRVVNTTGKVNDTKIYADGYELSGVTEVDFVACSEHGTTTLEIRLFGVASEIEGKAVFLIMCPDDGIVKPIRRIEYQDGTVLTFGDE